MDGVQNLPPHLQGEFMKNLEHMQIKDSLMYVIFILCCFEVHCRRQ